MFNFISKGVILLKKEFPMMINNGDILI